MNALLLNPNNINQIDFFGDLKNNIECNHVLQRGSMRSRTEEMSAFISKVKIAQFALAK